MVYAPLELRDSYGATQHGHIAAVLDGALPMLHPSAQASAISLQASIARAWHRSRGRP